MRSPLGVLYAYFLEKLRSIVAPAIAHNLGDGIEYALVQLGRVLLKAHASLLRALHLRGLGSMRVRALVSSSRGPRFPAQGIVR